MRIKKPNTGGGEAVAVDNITIVENENKLITSLEGVNLGLRVSITNEIDFKFVSIGTRAYIDWGVTDIAILRSSYLGENRYSTFPKLDLSVELFTSWCDQFGEDFILNFYMEIKDYHSKPSPICFAAKKFKSKVITSLPNLEGEYLLLSSVHVVLGADKTIDNEKTKVFKHYEKHQLPAEIPTPFEPQYWQFGTYQQMTTAKNTIPSGSTVKVLDASYDPQVKSGAAFYLTDANSSYVSFKLMCKENQLHADAVSIFQDDHLKLQVPSSFISHSVNTRILEDFDYTMKFDTDHFVLAPVGGVRTVPISFNGVVKYMTLQSYDLYFDRFDNGGKGKRVNWTIQAYIRNTEDIVNTKQIGKRDDGGINDVEPLSIDTSMITMQVSALIPSDNSNPREEDFTIHKYWKKALAPVEERFTPEAASHEHSYTQPDGTTIKFNSEGKLEAQFPTPEEQTAVQIDNYTIEKNGVVLTVPAALNPIRHNYTIKKDFQLDFDFNDKTFIKVTPRGADENGFLQIPIEIASSGQIGYLKLGSVNLPVSAFTGNPEFIHFGIIAHVHGTDLENVVCEYVFESDGSPIKYKPTQVDQKICIAQIRAKKPINTDGWLEQFVTVWKYWKAAVSEESSGAPAVDGYGVEYIDLNGVKTLSSVGGMTSNYYTLRYLQDFDFDFKAIFNHDTGNLIFVANPVGGNKVIKATRTGGHTDGSSLPKQTHFVSVKTLDTQLNGLERGKCHYLRFGSSMPTVEPSSPQNMFSHVSPEPDIKPNNNYLVNYGIVKIYIPKVGEAFDHGKIYIYKYWKSALATFDELMQDYQQRNP